MPDPKANESQLIEVTSPLRGRGALLAATILIVLGLGLAWSLMREGGDAAAVAPAPVVPPADDEVPVTDPLAPAEDEAPADAGPDTPTDVEPEIPPPAVKTPSPLPPERKVEEFPEGEAPGSR